MVSVGGGFVSGGTGSGSDGGEGAGEESGGGNTSEINDCDKPHTSRSSSSVVTEPIHSIHLGFDASVCRSPSPAHGSAIFFLYTDSNSFPAHMVQIRAYVLRETSAGPIYDIIVNTLEEKVTHDARSTIIFRDLHTNYIMNDTIELVHRFLKQMSLEHMKKKNGTLYVETLSAVTNGLVGSRHWLPVNNEFVTTYASNNIDILSKLLHIGEDNVVKAISSYEFNELPELNDADPCLFSFCNGIFDIDKCTFYPYDPLTDMSNIQNGIQVRPLSELPEDSRTCVFHNLVFRINEKMTFIPEIYKFFNDQDYNDRELLWVYALLGRALFNVNAYDNWNVVPVVLGKTMSGKNTLSNLMMTLVGVDNLHGLEGNQVNLEELHASRLMIGRRIEQSFSLDNSLLCTMVSGDVIDFGSKCKERDMQPWSTPMILFGNCTAHERFQHTSSQRRVAVIRFPNQIVDHMDKELFIKMRKSLDKFLVVITMAYHKLRSKLFWKHAPGRFKFNVTDYVD